MSGAVLPVVVFLLDGQRYGLPLAAAERVVRMVAVAPLPDAPAVVLGAVNVHGEIVAVVDVARSAERSVADYGPAARLLLVRAGDLPLAFPVDDVVGVLEVPEDDLVPTDLDRLRGIARLEDGLLLVQDLDAFLSADEARAVTAAVAATR